MMPYLRRRNQSPLPRPSERGSWTWKTPFFCKGYRPLSERTGRGYFEPPKTGMQSSEFLRHENPFLQRRLIVVFTFGHPLGQLDLVPGHFLTGDQLEQVQNAVQTG